MEGVSLYYVLDKGVVQPVKAVSVLFAFGFHTSEQIKEQMEVQGGRLLRCLFYSRSVIKSISIVAVDRIFSDRHLIV